MINASPHAILWVISYFLILIGSSSGRILEKTTTTCNGPCGQLALSCPTGQRIAIRDAIYSVQKKISTCRAFRGCTSRGQDVCCEQTAQDCLVPYPWEQSKMLYRNCSGRNQCSVQTERWDLENGQCALPRTQLSSQTTLNYVCVNESLIAEVCSISETIIEGRTIFAMMDSRGSHKPEAGSVCTCIAETIKWPTTNTIAVFLVDIRLNSPASSECSNVSLTVRSGNNDKAIHCPASTEPPTNLPFVAVLNNSNVATLTMEVSHSLPELVWLGFEANENEDIRLSCKLQGLSPVLSNSGDTTLQYGDSGSENTAKENLNLAAIIGGVMAAVVLGACLAAILAFFIIRKRKSPVSHTKTEEPQPEYDITYYSSTEDSLRSFQNTAETRRLNNGSGSFPELYVSAEEVIANKRKSNPGGMSTPHVSDKIEDEYATAFEEIDLTKNAVAETDINGSNRNHASTKDDNYDRLNRRYSDPSDAILDSYHQLAPERRQSADLLSRVGNRQRRQDLDENNACSNLGVVNEGYGDSNAPELPAKFRRAVRDDSRSDYFELENPARRGRSNATYYGLDDPRSRNDRATIRRTNRPGASGEFVSEHYDDSGPVYNDAESEAGHVDPKRSDANIADGSSTDKTMVATHIAVKEDRTNRSAEVQSPTPAPRRKSRASSPGNIRLAD